MIFHDSNQKIFFQNIKIKLNSNAGWLWSPQLWFFRPQNLCSLNDLSGLNSLNSLNGLNDLDSLISLKNLLILMVWLSLAPKWPIPVPFCGMYHKKSNFSLISDTLSVGGYWGQPMSLFWKPVDETQISKPPEATRHHNSIKLLILLPLRADLLYILHYETPCIRLFRVIY
jgi:hypothetical protein